MVASICLDRASTKPFPLGVFAFADFLERGIIALIMVHQDLSFWESYILEHFSPGMNQEGFARSC
jgi:hypothetical protein